MLLCYIDNIKLQKELKIKGGNIMKTLIVHDKDGNIVFTSVPANSTYKLIVEDVPGNKEIVGIDNAGHLILKDKEATNEDNKKLQNCYF